MISKAMTPMFIIAAIIFLMMGYSINSVFYGVGILIVLLTVFWIFKQQKIRYERFIQNERDNWNVKKKRKYEYDVFASLDELDETKDKRFRLDKQTWNDLNMEDIFKNIDRTFTIPGQQYLYRTLRNICTDKDELLTREKAISSLSENSSFREKIVEILANIGTEDGSFTTRLLFQSMSFNEKYVLFLKVSRFALPISLLIFLVDLPLGIIAFIASMILNTKSYYDTKKHIGSYADSMKYMSKVMTQCEKMLKPEIESLDIDIEETSLALNKTTPIKKRFDKLVFGNNQRGKMAEFSIFYDYINMIFLIEPILFYDAMKYVEKYLDDMKIIYETIGKVDMLLSIAAIRTNLPLYTIPIFEEGSPLEIKDAVYIILDNPVANSIRVDKGNGVMITGSNMSGKSTFLRTIATNIVLAQTICTATASYYKAKVLIPFTSISISDNIESGESYYLAEVRSIKRIIDYAKENNTVVAFIDEIFSGTNRIERTAASIEILDYLKRNEITAFVATHDLEISREISGYDKYYFKEEVSENDINFDYHLYEGISNTSNAIEILKLVGYPEEIYSAAKKKAVDIAKTI
jgi:DNA mismatch repair ATPase MutS